MKKAILFILLIIAASANAGTVDLYIDSLNGQPIEPTKEITIQTDDVVSYVVVYQANPGWYLFTLCADIYIDSSSTGSGELSLPEPYSEIFPLGLWDPGLSIVPPHTPDRITLDLTAAELDSVPPGIIACQLYFHCSGSGDVFIKIEDSLNCGVSNETELTGLFPLEGFGSGLIIHQAYSPACWDCPCQPYGDANGDGKIDIFDYFLFKKAYGTDGATDPHGTGIGEYNCCCDFNHDYKVNVLDYFTYRSFYGIFPPICESCSDISCE